jgi:hypothetical protein
MTTEFKEYDPAEIREAIIRLAHEGPDDWRMSEKELSNLLFQIGL